MAYKRILFGTDGTARAAASSRVATELAKAGKAELIVAYVWERPEGAHQVQETGRQRKAGATRAPAAMVGDDFSGRAARLKYDASSARPLFQIRINEKMPSPSAIGTKPPSKNLTALERKNARSITRNAATSGPSRCTGHCQRLRATA